MVPPIGRSDVDRLVVEHLPAALRFALRLTGDPHIAVDVVQEALCLVLRRWRSYRGEASFCTWMLRIVVNVDRDRRRRQRDTLPLPTDEIISGEAQPVEQAAADELHATVRVVIDRLPGRQRAATVVATTAAVQRRPEARRAATAGSLRHTPVDTAPAAVVPARSVPRRGSDHTAADHGRRAVGRYRRSGNRSTRPRGNPQSNACCRFRASTAQLLVADSRRRNSWRGARRGRCQCSTIAGRVAHPT